MQINHDASEVNENGRVVTKIFKLGQEATHVWRDMNEPRHHDLINDYSRRAKHVSRRFKAHVQLRAADDRILLTVLWTGLTEPSARLNPRNHVGKNSSRRI